MLPVWIDTFEFARSIGLLDVGRWRIPQYVVERDQRPWQKAWRRLGRNNVRPLSSEQNAHDLARFCHHNGGGQVIAAGMILMEMGEPCWKSEEDSLRQSNGVDRCLA